METSQGRFLVKGIFQGYKGHPLKVMERDTGEQLLCDHDVGRCKELVD